MNIFILVAGTNNPSNSNMLSDAFIQGLQQHEGTTADKHLLRDLHIEHFNLDYYAPQCNREEDFCTLQAAMEACDGFVFATPVWNFGVPAHLKNFIDRMGSFALAEDRSTGTLNGKPFYLIFTGGAPKPAWLGMMQKTTSFVPEALQYFGASYIGHHFEGKCTVGQGEFGLVVDQRPESLESLRKQGFEFGKVVKTYKETGKAPMQHRAKGKVMRWGEALLKKVT